MLSEGQEVTFEYQGTNYLLRVNSIMVVDEHAEQQSVSRGKPIPQTAFVYETRSGSGLKITGSAGVVRHIVAACMMAASL